MKMSLKCDQTWCLEQRAAAVGCPCCVIECAGFRERVLREGSLVHPRKSAEGRAVV